MCRYFIQLAYNGRNYHGWQIQPNGISIQEELQNAISLLLREKVDITGCGRTDTGVHAQDFYAHFDAEKYLDNIEREKLVQRLNSFLGEDILIKKIYIVKPEVHARFDALSRTYQYHVGLSKLPFRNDFTHHIFYVPDISLMNQGAQLLFKYEDFSCFSKLHTQTKTNNCKILYAQWSFAGDELVFTIKANRFLRNMVRAIVGTLLDVGRRKITLDDLQKILDSKNRSCAGTSMPAKALFLTEVEYPEDIFVTNK